MQIAKQIGRGIFEVKPQHSTEQTEEINTNNNRYNSSCGHDRDVTRDFHNRMNVNSIITQTTALRAMN
jgi:hypothetical protein